MKNRNICKFISDSASVEIKADSFIFEGNREVMQIPVKLNNNRMILVKSGNGKFVMDGKEFPYCAGTLIFAFEHESFCALPGAQTEYMYIEFSGVRAEELFSRFGIDKFNRSFSSFDGVVPLWHDSILRATDENLSLVAESMILYTFSRFKAVGAKTPLVNEIIRITEENFTVHEFSLTDVAEQLSYNPKYLSHLFKEKMGTSYSEYLTNMRIKYAITLLDYGIDSIKNVAFLSGYSDSLYFSSVFKKVVGISPKEYRRKMTDSE